MHFTKINHQSNCCSEHRAAEKNVKHSSTKHKNQVNRDHQQIFHALYAARTFASFHHLSVLNCVRLHQTHEMRLITTKSEKKN